MKLPRKHAKDSPHIGHDIKHRAKIHNHTTAGASLIVPSLVDLHNGLLIGRRSPYLFHPGGVALEDL